MRCFYTPAQWMMARLQWAAGEIMCHLPPGQTDLVTLLCGATAAAAAAATVPLAHVFDGFEAEERSDRDVRDEAEGLRDLTPKEGEKILRMRYGYTDDDLRSVRTWRNSDGWSRLVYAANFCRAEEVRALLAFTAIPKARRAS